MRSSIRSRWIRHTLIVGGTRKTHHPHVRIGAPTLTMRIPVAYTATAATKPALRPARSHLALSGQVTVIL